MKIGIFGSEYQAGKQNAIRRLFDLLEQGEAQIWVEQKFHDYLSKAFAYTPPVAGIINTDLHPLDMAVSLGGDGTFLRTAAWVGHQNIPILGINAGRLGFLADTGVDEIDETIADIFQNRYRIEERSLLHLESELNFHGSGNFALNEAAFLKRDTSSMIAVCTYLNDIFLTKYWADGLIISTPAGSTGYNLSVNGPILVPQSPNFVLSPVAPHSLNVRPLVIPDDYVIRLKVESRSKNFLVSLDGRSEVFPSGSEFTVRKADFGIRIVKRVHQEFYETLRRKLLWGSDVRR
jgi:NAD+ kinase